MINLTATDKTAVFSEEIPAERVIEYATEEVMTVDDPAWYKNAIIYELHVRGFYDSDGDGIGDFKGLITKLDYLKDLGITALWLLPFYPSPLKDDGYDISDYCNVYPKYGTLEDFAEFIKEAHKRGIRVITELVLNHTSDQHPWFQRSRLSPPGSMFRNYYVWSDSPEKYKEARIIFKDFETSNWTWDHVTKAYIWHRFYSHQPDLNYENPDVEKAMFEVLDFWLSIGVDGLRLDAVPYIFEREGTMCENLPETHEFLKKLRAFVDTKYKNKMLLAEANQWPEDASAYFGKGDECHMAFHFPLMPRIFMALKMEDRFPVFDIIESTPQIPANCQWALFLRNHDELTLEMVTDEERDYMYRVYARDRDARINLGIRRRLSPLLENDRRKIELMNVLLFTLPGTPIIYYGDEIGMGDNYNLGDRNGVRTPMQWTSDLNAGFSKANPQRLYLPLIIDPEYHYEVVNVENQQRNPSSLLWWMKHLIRMREKYRALSQGTIEFIYPDNSKILVYIREYEKEKLLIAVNLSRNPQVAEFDLSRLEGHLLQEIFGNSLFPAITKKPYVLSFTRYGYYVFRMVTLERVAERAVAPRPRIKVKLPHQLFERESRDVFEKEVLPGYLITCRWFGGKAYTIENVHLREILPLGKESKKSYYMLIIDVYYREGIQEAYLLPVAMIFGSEAKDLIDNYPGVVMADITAGAENGVICEAAVDEGFRSLLFNIIADKMVVHGKSGELQAIGNQILEPSTKKELKSRLLSMEQSNISIVYNEEFILKLYRKAEEGLNPELELGEHLTKIGFPNVPQFLGWIKYTEKWTEPVVVVLLHKFIRNTSDALSLFSGEVERYFEKVLALKTEVQAVPSIISMAYQGIPELLEDLVGAANQERISILGKRTGEFHLALASHKEKPSFIPEPFNYLYIVALSHSMTSYTKKILQAAGRATNVSDSAKKEIESIITNQGLITQRFRNLREKKIEALRIRIHGNYNLHEILFTGRDFVIIDYAGDDTRHFSERRLKFSPLRDVASMMGSFHSAAYSKLLNRASLNPDDANLLLKWTNAWYKVCSATFLRSYLDTLAGSGLVPEDAETLSILLECFLLNKTIYELGYELNNRPELVMIPITGIKDLLGITNAQAEHAN